jgi:hypothetical protein
MTATAERVLKRVGQEFIYDKSYVRLTFASGAASIFSRTISSALVQLIFPARHAALDHVIVYAHFNRLLHVVSDRIPPLKIPLGVTRKPFSLNGSAKAFTSCWSYASANCFWSCWKTRHPLSSGFAVRYREMLRPALRKKDNEFTDHLVPLTWQGFTSFLDVIFSTEYPLLFFEHDERRESNRKNASPTLGGSTVRCAPAYIG